MKSGKLLVVAMLAVAATLAVSQQNPNTDIGLQAFGSYHGGDLDSVSLTNGNLTLHIPLISYPQRGKDLSLDFFIRYNNKGFIGLDRNQCAPLDHSCSPVYKWLWRGNGVEVVRGGTLGLQDNSQSVPIPNCPGGPSYCNPVTVEMLNAMVPDGGSHLLGGLCTDMACPPGSNFWDAIALDASGIHYLSPFALQCVANQPPPVPILIEANGVRHIQQARSQYAGQYAGQSVCPTVSATPGYWAYDSQNGTPVQKFDSYYVASSVDPNGNTISVTPSGWVDTLGRLIPGSAPTTGDYGATNKYEMILPGVPTNDFSNCPVASASARIWNTPGPNSGTSNFKLCYSDIPLATNFHTPYPCGTSTCYYFEWNFTVRLLTAVVLPDLSFWRFDYNNYGDLAKVTLPTGGSISYAWITHGWYTADINTPVSRTISSRTVDANDGAGPRTWTYHWDAPASNFATIPAFTQVTVTDPEGNDAVHTFTPVVGYQDFHETKTQFYQGSYSSGTLLKTVDTQYSGSSNPYDMYNFQVYSSPVLTSTNIVPTSITTTRPNGTKSQTVYAYDPGTTYNAFNNLQGTGGTWNTYTAIYGSRVRTDDYDFGSGSVGALLRSTLTNYQWQSNPNYLSANLLTMPSSVAVNNGSGNKMAETDYTYDEPTYLTTYSNSLPAGTHVAPPNPSPVRGNLSTVSSWLNTGGNVVTHTNWYDTGEAYQQIDALGNATTHSYDPFYAGAYSTMTCSPKTGSIAHCVSGTYDFNTGLPTSFTNENATSQASGNTPGDSAHTTSYSYDQMLRMTSAVLPLDPNNGNAQAQTLLTYSASNVFPLTVQRQKSITPATMDSITTTFDGVGRSVKTQHATPGGTATVDTVYDSLGRVASVSNPYFSTSDPTYGIAHTAYDALGRVTQVTKQDGSVSLVAYQQPASALSAADCTTTTDEVGKQRKSCSDALGRLVEVDEPGGGFAGTAASGGLTISGTLQSKPATSGTPGTGSVSISGAEQSKSGIGAHPATPGTGSVTISGVEQSSTTTTCGAPYYYDDSGNLTCTERDITTYDFGTLTITVNGHGDSYSFAAADTSATIASGLANAINGDGGASVNASVSGSTLYLTSRSTGAAANYSLATTVSESMGSFSASASGASLTGGTDAYAGTTTYDSGTCTVTISGTGYSASFGQGATAGSIATALANAISAGSLASASASGATISLTAKTSGTGSNYSLGGGNCSYNSSTFSAPSFAANPSGSSLTGGTNGSPAVADAGTVTLSIPGPSVDYTATANYGNGTGQDSTASAVAGDLVAKMQAQLPSSNPPFTISAGGATININWNSVGTAGNVTMSTTSTTTQTAYFSTPSFASCAITANPQSCSTALAGGSDPISPSLNTPYMTTYQYDALGNLLCVHQKATDSTADISCLGTSPPSVPASWRQRFFTYDSLSRLLTASNPESGTISYGYDAVGNLLQKTSPAPNAPAGSTATQTISYCYDALNRVTGKAYSAQTCTNGLLPPGTAAVSYFYDQASYQNLTIANGIGRLTGISDQAGTGAYSFDALGRIAIEQRSIAGVTKSMSYTYNLDGSVKTLTYPSGAVITYTPDAAGRMLSAVDSGKGINYATGASYGPDSALTSFVSGGTITNSFSYNKRLQPVFMSAGTSGQTVFSIGYDFHLGNGDNGNVWGITNNKDNTRNQTFTYDALNRLASAQNAGTDCLQMTLNNKTKYWGNGYTYDAWGNLTGKGNLPGGTSPKCGPESLDVTADTHNQLHVKAGADYQYDAAGNTTYDAKDALYLTYDPENRITGAGGYTYTYDADGNRVAKSNGSTGTLYWYMSPGIVAESDLSGNLQAEYVFFDGERVARKDFPGLAVSYYFSDHLKTASVITDAAGNIKAESDYYPWGGELQFLANDSNHYKFTGKERDAETGLDYFGARYYSNGLGRFITPDWSGHPVPVPYADLDDPQSLNQYSYVRNLPTVRADADGHCDSCRDAWDYTTGVVQGIVSSATWGLVGAPKSSDSVMSLGGQLLGTAIEGGVSTSMAVDGLKNAGAGLLAELPTGGTSTLVVVGGGVEALVGVGGAVGAGKNVGAILNAMSKKGTEPGSRPGQDFTPAGKREIDARDGNVCQGHGCSRTVRSVKNTRGKPTPPDQRQRHHIVPKSQGGSGTPENAETLCPACHKEKHRKIREAKKNQT